MNHGCHGCVFYRETDLLKVCRKDGGRTVAKAPAKRKCHRSLTPPKNSKVINGKIFVKLDQNAFGTQIKEENLFCEVVDSRKNSRGIRLYQLRNVCTGRFSRCAFPSSVFVEF